MKNGSQELILLKKKNLTVILAYFEIDFAFALNNRWQN